MPRPTLPSLIALICALLAAGLLVGACGGEEEGEPTGGGETTEETAAGGEEDAVEKAVIAYGEADGSDTCQFVSQEAIESVGGIEQCETEFEDSSPTEYEIQDVRVNGDQAEVDVLRENGPGETETLKVVNEDGEWLVDPRS
ncbi:MAG TPA: hypothetical protein VGR10_04010 [Thermoleophilaceae bacterium]|nr:hypothetical protein [Thermoleophilaceae bacterium]